MGDIVKGTPTFKMVNLALFVGAIATYASIYTTQPLLPLLSTTFHITPAVASLSVSVTTGALGVALLFAGPLSDSLGRKSMMSFSLVATGVVGVLQAFVPSFHSMLFLRVVQGILVAGLPATAMAYLSEEIDPRYLGVAMGLYISGNSIGGVSGRIVSAQLAEMWNWRMAIGGIGVISLVCSSWFARVMPASRHFRAQPLKLGRALSSLLESMRDPGLRALYAVSFLTMGSFVTLYNYISYALLAPPYRLSSNLVSWIFMLYLMGTFSSTWAGRLCDRYGRRHLLLLVIGLQLSGVLVTLFMPLAMKVLGIAIFTFGFFAAHSTASGWVGERAPTNKGAASSLYLFFYYLGSSIAGTAGGTVWLRWGWPGVAGFIGLLLVLALGAGAYLGRTASSPVTVNP